MKETTNLKLKLYDTADAPNLVAGYNASMEAIDKASAEWGTSDIPADIDWSQLKAALAAIETMKTQIGELQTQIAAKANAADVYTKTATDGKFALKTDIPDVSSFITKTAADAAYQAKGSYATTSTVTALTTRVATAEGEIDTLQTGLAAATAAGTAQLTVADLTAAKTNAKNLVTA